MQISDEMQGAKFSCVTAVMCSRAHTSKCGSFSVIQSAFGTKLNADLFDYCVVTLGLTYRKIVAKPRPFRDSLSWAEGFVINLVGSEVPASTPCHCAP